MTALLKNTTQEDIDKYRVEVKNYQDLITIKIASKICIKKYYY